MLNYVNHRAIFEGMNSRLFAPNSGRMLWMTQPAWPSNMWQIFSHDYDTHAAFYGTKKAAEQIHIQLDFSNYEVQVINNTPAELQKLAVTATIYSLDNKKLASANNTVNAPASSSTAAFKLGLEQPFATAGVVLIKLELRNAAGELLSDNFYWLGPRSESYQALTRMPAATINATSTWKRAGDTAQLTVRLQNSGQTAALATKLTLLDTQGQRILPAYYSDNYISLLPGESREVKIEYAVSAAQGTPAIALRGWNLAPSKAPVTAEK
jgi:hypothetical protein